MTNSNLIIVLIVIISCVIVFVIVKWVFNIWRQAKIISFLTPAITELSPFYKLLEILFDHSHAMERHSPLTTIDQHIKRAVIGITPEGIQSFPVHSGRRNSHYPMLYAIDTAKKLWKEQTLQKKISYKLRFDKTIGFVTKRFTKVRVETKMAIVVINENGLVVTAFPILELSEKTNNVIDLKLVDSNYLDKNILGK